MNLKIKSIHIENFKGIENLDVEFNAIVTTFKGRNGLGKSTIADAISWCLFGKNARGETTFGLKTRDKDGNEIPHLDHSVSMTIVVDEVQHTLSRTLKEKWSKPRGSEEELLAGNVLKYSIDSEECTKADFDKYVFSLAGVELFPLLSTPTAFPALHWQDQRRILGEMAGKVNPEDVANGDPRFEALLKELQDKSLEAYRKHLSYQIKELKKSIDVMPTKIQTLKQTLPDVTADESTINECLASSEEKLKDLNSQILSAKTGSVDLIATKNIKDKIQFAETRLTNIEISKRNLARDEAEKHDAKCIDANRIWMDAKNTYQSLVQKRQSLDLIIDKCNERIQEIQTELAMGTADWKALKDEKFTFDESMTICPTCGQELPVDQAQERYKEALERFNLAKAARKEKLLAKAEKLNAELEQAKQNKQENIEMLSITDEQIQSAKSAVSEAEKNYNAVNEEKVPTAQDLLNADENYQNIKAEVARLVASCNNPTSSDADTSELEAEIASVSAEVEDYKKQLAMISHAERINDLISKTKEDWQNLNKQLTALEQKEDIAIAFADKVDAVLEDKVNSLFSIVRFKLFKTLVDGKTKEPFCTATVDGVDYKDLNSATKMNAGLDVVNVLSKHYDTYVPVTIDNAEANNNILATSSQQIRLYVTTDSKLIIE